MSDAASPLRIAIVDDEPLARLRLQQVLGELRQWPGLPPLQLVGQVGDAESVLALLDDPGCDLLLLDIALPGRDGLRLAEALRRRPDPPQVVFVSAHAEHALRAFEVDATDYLTKPVRRDRLAAALDRAAQRRAAQPVVAPPAGADPALAGVLVVTDRARVLRLPLSEVWCLRADHKLVRVSSARGEWLIDESLAELEPKLGEGFLRVHRNAIVARHAVRALERGAGSGGEGEGADGADAEGWQLRLVDGQRLAVSRRQLSAVREALAAEGR